MRFRRTDPSQEWCKVLLRITHASPAPSSTFTNDSLALNEHFEALVDAGHARIRRLGSLLYTTMELLVSFE